MTDSLEKKLRAVEREKTGRYAVRTRHRDEAGRPRFINRLILEDSPYLLQHAHNPVDWFSWGAEAFGEAARLNRPIFLSIGYSTCHWCHVMEAESFDDLAIARLLNQSYVCIKLDREQFPDIDDYYMTGVQLMSGQGGWPMSSFLLPDGRPFYGATYFPPAQFASLLQHIAGLWAEKQDDLEQSAAGVAERIARLLAGRQAVRELELQSLTAAADRLLEREDRHHGGLAGAPKFPQEPLLHYCLDGVVRDRDLRKLGFLERALTGMACGGIYDQVGGGFHRYSTDAHWLVPHFEKMLYNQSQLTPLYLRAWALTGRPFYLRVLRQTLDYVLREMQQPDGGFYSATDADSEEQEGRFFVWSLAALQDSLEPDEFALVNRLYAPSAAGNFEGGNILALAGPLDEITAGQPFAALEERLDAILNKLLAIRDKRVRPLRDDKLIVAWAAAMAGSLAWAGWELNEPRYRQAAQRAVEFIWQHNVVGQQSLRRIYLDGEAAIPAQLEDYASLCEALITLFDVTTDQSYLERAARLAEEMLDRFWNDKSGGFFLGPSHGQGPQLVRSQSAADGATLSAYAVAVQCLALLNERRELLPDGTRAQQPDYQQLFQQAVSAASAELDEFPASHVTLIRAIRAHLQDSCRPVRYGAGGRLRIAVRHLDRAGQIVESRHLNLVLQLNSTAGFRVTTETDADLDRVPLQVELDPGERHWMIERTAITDEGGDLEDRQAGIGPGGQQLAISLWLQRTAEEADGLSASVGLRLRVQLCGEEVCLAPDSFNFRI